MKRTHWIKHLMLVAALALGGAMVVGCERDVGDNFQRAGEEMQEGMQRTGEQAGEQFEEFGQDIQNQN